MVLTYGMSLPGRSHKADGTACQDAHGVAYLRHGWVAVAVADGVGSAKHSDEAAKLAVDSCLQHISDRIKGQRVSFSDNISDTVKWEDLPNVMAEGYQAAQKQIWDVIVRNGRHEHDYDTTLSVAIYDGKRIAYGHCGDGGVVGLRNDGGYVAVTKPQKGEDGVTVVPLRAGKDAWQFGFAEGDFASVLVATDGVYDAFFPYLLKGQACEIYVPLIRFFMDNNDLGINMQSGADGLKAVEQKRREFLEGESFASVQDDLTVVVGVNAQGAPQVRSAEYYAEPNWADLQEQWNKKAYPHLYVEAEQSSFGVATEGSADTADTVGGE